MEDHFIIFVHPDVEKDVRQISARCLWRDAYRAYRKQLNPREILKRHATPCCEWESEFIEKVCC